MTDDAPLSDPLERLPHGAEFRFVDRLTELDPGQSGAGEYRIRGDEPFLRGHFPGEPMFPGVLLVEAIAQLAGVVAQADPVHPPLPHLKLTAIRTAKITGTGRPGETIELEVQVTGRLDHLVQARGTAGVQGQTVLEVEVVLSGDRRSE